MNDALKMQISAFVDGELPDNESELLLRRLSQDAALRQQAAAYLEIGRLARREQEFPGMERLRSRISAMLGDEPAEEEAQPQEAGSMLMTPASGIAVAAAVAAVALLGLGQLSNPDNDGLDTGAVAIDLAPAYTEPTLEQILANNPTERLRELGRRHEASSQDLGSNGILSRLVTLELSEERLIEVAPNPDLVTDDDAAQAADDVNNTDE